MPPVDWDGYNDPKYKMHEVLKDEKNEIIRSSQNRKKFAVAGFTTRLSLDRVFILTANRKIRDFRP